GRRSAGWLPDAMRTSWSCRAIRSRTSTSSAARSTCSWLGGACSASRRTDAMKVGLLLPQGYFNEFEGWRPADAWARILEIARLGERLGFDSLWTGEHVLAKWDPEGPAFDCVTIQTAVAAHIPRVDIGFCVINSTFRNPAMTAKMAATLDTISGGRLVLGLGAGFKDNEAR